MQYTELQVTSNFSFLRGASHPEELAEQAAALGYDTIAVNDRNSFAGIVRAHAAAKKCGIRLIPSCRIDLLDAPSLLAYPQTKKGYATLCRLLTTGNLRAEKGSCHLYKADVLADYKDILFAIIPPATLSKRFDLEEDFKNMLAAYRAALGDQVYLAAARQYNGDDQKYIYRLAAAAKQYGMPLLATNDVHYHEPARRELQDILTCIREKCTIHTAGFRLHPNAERYMKPEAEMLRLFRQYPDAIARTREITEACTFSLDELQYEYPTEIISPGATPQEELTRLTWEGADRLFGAALPEKTRATINYELDFIEKMNYASYFLTVYDIVRFARSKDILCQGRGSAANSTVCYCLGITSVNPAKFDLLFERFISSARNEPPDIDVDFEHERREEVIQYIYEKYGRDRAAIVATVTQQHQKGSLRDVAKAMGLSQDAVNRLSRTVGGFYSDVFEEDRILAEQGLNPQDRHLKKLFELTRQYMGFPRQLGQHTGGFVITKGKLTELCPVLNARMENRTCIEWNKDDIDALGFMKVDVLSLGMLTCIRKAFVLAAAHYGHHHTLASIPQDDPAVYEMISRADTIGVFQIESRAQQSMLPRLKPKTFYDLVIEVAIVRPGPIQGDMVHPYLRRRNGQEPVEYPSKELEEILGRTLGVPLFQEQAMKIAIVAAGFTPAEADMLRRSMATFKARGLVSQFHKKLVEGMTARGYTQDYAERVFRQLEGFGSYGFPESHAVSFALLVYVSSWLKYYYPEIFACALLNSLPMGFYQPAQIIQDVQRHGVTVLPVDVNHSCWDHSLEAKQGNYFALRLGFRQVKGLREEDMQRLVAARTAPFQSVAQLRDAGISVAVLERLADADCFRSLEMDRRQSLWEVSVKDHPEQLFRGQPSDIPGEESIELPRLQEGEHVIQDYATLSLSLKAHPVQFVRPRLQQLQVTPLAALGEKANGSLVKVAGLVLVRQRPETAKGVCFMTIEDETGCGNLVLFGTRFDEYRKAILQSRLFMAEGTLQIESGVIHVIVEKCYNISRLLQVLSAPAPATQPELPFGDANRITEQSIPGARNFH